MGRLMSERSLAQALYPNLASEASRPSRSRGKAQPDTWLAAAKPKLTAEQLYEAQRVEARESLLRHLREANGNLGKRG